MQTYKIGITNNGNVAVIGPNGARLCWIVRDARMQDGANFPAEICKREVEAESATAAAMMLLSPDQVAAVESIRAEREAAMRAEVEAKARSEAERKAADRARLLECVKILGRRGIAAARKLSRGRRTDREVFAVARKVRGAHTIQLTAAALDFMASAMASGRSERRPSLPYYRRTFGREPVILPVGTPAERLRLKRAEYRKAAAAARRAEAERAKQARAADRKARELARAWGNRVPVPLPSGRSELAEVWRELNTSVEWNVKPWFENVIDADSPHESRKGRRGWYTVAAADHRARVKSFGVIGRGGAVLTITQGVQEPRTLRAPDGCVWLRDEHGLKVALANARAVDYHPTGAEFRSWDREEIGARLLANRDTRLRMAAEEAAFEAEMAGVFVCVSDSIRAGNCRQGTESWAAQHGLDVRKHYPATEVLSRANGDAGRVRIVIKAAIIQARKDNARGFAVLAEHGAGCE